jgi:hypothetical protein
MEQKKQISGNELSMLAEMKRLIAYTLNGKRRMPGGARIKPSTVINYSAVLNIPE